MIEHSVVGGWNGMGRHRSFSVKKVDNGYIATFIVQKEDRSAISGYISDEEEYVFYTIFEVIHAVKAYLEAGKASMSRGQ